ncbi:hypothetical protein LCGC14_2759540, partial [marine sediment metagenome]
MEDKIESIESSAKWDGDPHVKAALDWFLSFIDRSEWERKKKDIEEYIGGIIETKKTPPSLASNSSRIVYPYDRFAWYLYLADSYTSHIGDYEFSQGARVIPLFKIIGQNLELMRKASGVEQLVLRMSDKEKDSPDSALFELLVGLLYLRNFWKRITFLPGSKTSKTPDIHVESALNEYFVECKRLSKSSDYSERERVCWLKMSQPLREYLTETKKPLIVDIIFHRELATLDVNIIKKELIPKLDLIGSKGTVIDNDIWTVKVDFVDMAKIRRHLRKFSVKIPSTVMTELIFKGYEQGKGYTPLILGKTAEFNNTYLESVIFAA